ncbi:rRNA maturation RNase YbeY [archaeon]|nr:MAG: rRNA maturation RNase YbeY [archaeon]
MVRPTPHVRACSPLLTRARAHACAQHTACTWSCARDGRLCRSVGLRLVSRPEIAALNRKYRHKDAATDILSFPRHPLTSPEAFGIDVRQHDRDLGDLIACPDLIVADAMEQGFDAAAYWPTLLTHGVVHLLGYDHERDADYVRMNRREVGILRTLVATGVRVQPPPEEVQRPASGVPSAGQQLA